jgi:hypothetical protein
MKKSLATLALLLFIQPYVFTWGFFAHKRINKMAVYTLPEQMGGFFLENIDYLSEHAVDADKRRYSDEEEAPRHYIDIDHYSVDSPFVVMPQYWEDAVEKFTVDTLRVYGILPWHIQLTYYRLVSAMEEHDADKVLYLAADLGHYIADAHVPLHTTENYNGQFTGQKGIHAFWESRLPELFAEDYDYLVAPVRYQKSVLQTSWGSIAKSYAAKDSVLLFEKRLHDQFESDQKYSYEKEGGKKVYSKAYSTAYHESLNGMVERQLRHAIHTLGSIWYSAWVDAGQPNMDKWVSDEE